MENRAFNEMFKAARAWLEGRDPADIARKTDFAFDPENALFQFETLGRKIAVSWPECSFSEEVSWWYRLVILHYMHHADGFPVLGKPVSFSQLRDGLIRGGGFDSDSASALSNAAQDKTAPQLQKMFESIGARMIDSNADLCMEIPFLPNYPVAVKFYLADEEFAAEGRMLLDASADHYLPVEDAVTVGMVILEELGVVV